MATAQAVTPSAPATVITSASRTGGTTRMATEDRERANSGGSAISAQTGRKFKVTAVLELDVTIDDLHLEQMAITGQSAEESAMVEAKAAPFSAYRLVERDIYEVSS